MSDQPPPDADPEVWAMLPEDVRADILRDAQRQANAIAEASGSSGSNAPTAAAATAAPPSGEVNIAQFLATLPPDLRSQVLLTATPEEIARMPPELRAEVDSVRMQAAVEQRDRPEQRHAPSLAVASGAQGGGLGGPGAGREDPHQRSSRGSGGGPDRPLPRDTFESPEVQGKPLLKDSKQALALAALQGNARVSSMVRGMLDSAMVSLTLQPEARIHLVAAMLETEAFPLSRRPRNESLHFLTKVFEARADARTYAVQTHAAALFALLSKMQTLDNGLAVETDSPTAILKVLALLADQLKRVEDVDESSGLVALSGLLSWDDCPEDLFSLACTVAKGLVSAEPGRSEVLLSSLTAGTSPLAMRVAEDFAAVADRLASGGSAEDEPVTSTEVRLLRAVKTIKTLQVEGKESVLSTIPLHKVWAELSRALDVMEQRIVKANKAAEEKEAAEKAAREEQRQTAAQQLEAIEGVVATAAAAGSASGASSATAAWGRLEADMRMFRARRVEASRRFLTHLASNNQREATMSADDSRAARDDSESTSAPAAAATDGAGDSEQAEDMPELVVPRATVQNTMMSSSSSSSAAAAQMSAMQSQPSSSSRAQDDNDDDDDVDDFPELFIQGIPRATTTTTSRRRTAPGSGDSEEARRIRAHVLDAAIDVQASLLEHMGEDDAAAVAGSGSSSFLERLRSSMISAEASGAVGEESRQFLQSIIAEANSSMRAPPSGGGRGEEDDDGDEDGGMGGEDEDGHEHDQEEGGAPFRLNRQTESQLIRALQQMLIRMDRSGERAPHFGEDGEEDGGGQRGGGMFGEEDDEDGHEDEGDEEEEEEEEDDGDDGLEEEEEEEEEEEDGEEGDDDDGMDDEDDEEHDLDDILQNLHGLQSQRRAGGGHSRNHLSKLNVPGLTRFLPILEVYFEANGDDSAVEKFALEHALALNTLVRNSPKVLRDSLKALVTRRACRKVLTFENKRAFFKHGIKQLPRPMRPLRLSLRRDHVVEDSIAQLGSRTPEEMRGGLSVMFRGEEGIDAGGVSREWFEVLIREMFKPDYALFKQSADSTAFQPDPRSYYNPEHLSNFKFVGRIVGKALLEGYYIPAHFTRSFYKHVLGREVTPNDLQSLDPQYHKSLMDILSMDDVAVLDLTFTTEVEEFDVRKTIELVPNGASMSVTNENKQEWVKLVAQQKMTVAIRGQINAFLQGFYEMVPKELIQMFNPQELELLISGMPKIDLEDLMRNTEYNGGFARDAPQIEWFWHVLRSLDEADKARFLMFVTGTSKVPLEGFANLVGMRGIQRFSIHRGPKSDETLPTAHTCFNQLDLPQYSCETVLRDKLMKAIREGSEGFGFA